MGSERFCLAARYAAHAALHVDLFAGKCDAFAGNAFSVPISAHPRCCGDDGPKPKSRDVIGRVPQTPSRLWLLLSITQTSGTLSMLKPCLAALALVATLSCPLAARSQDAVGTLTGII